MAGKDGRRVSKLSHLVKIIAHWSEFGRRTLAIMIPNSDTLVKAYAVPQYLSDDVTTLDRVEAVIGFRFFDTDRLGK
jgi:hypothetical protein